MKRFYHTHKKIATGKCKMSTQMGTQSNRTAFRRKSNAVLYDSFCDFEDQLLISLSSSLFQL